MELLVDGLAFAESPRWHANRLWYSDMHRGVVEAVTLAEVIAVKPDGATRVVADNMLFPNGSVITPDGSTLIVAQSFGRDLVAFSIDADGGLSGRRQWADLEKGTPDGIRLDAEGAVWYADPVNGDCVRVAEGGAELDRVASERKAFACMLGGSERRHLFVLTTDGSLPRKSRIASSGRIHVAGMGVPGAGLP